MPQRTRQQIAQRREDVLTLFMQGYTQEAIAEQVGVTQSQISQDIKSIRQSISQGAKIILQSTRLVCSKPIPLKS